MHTGKYSTLKSEILNRCLRGIANEVVLYAFGWFIPRPMREPLGQYCILDARPLLLRSMHLGVMMRSSAARARARNTVLASHSACSGCAHLTMLLTVCTVLRGIFKTGVSLSGFARLFFADNEEIRGNKNRRWRIFLRLRAARNGVLLERPKVAPAWRPYKTYHPPIINHLQSSYADVEHELTVMRKVFVNESILFIAGDGLALMRMNHLLASKPDIYFDQSLAIIPIQGAHHCTLTNPTDPCCSHFTGPIRCCMRAC